MKKINIVGVLAEVKDWLFHPIANYRELQDYRNDYEKEILNFQDIKDKLEEKIRIEKNKHNDLQKKYKNVLTELGQTEKKLNEYTTAFPGDLHNYLDMQVKLEEWEKQGTLNDKEIRDMKAMIRTLEQKVIYRNNVIDTLRKTRKELKEQIEQLKTQLSDARNEVIALAKKVEFYEKQNKKTPKEKVDYLMKRSKK